MATRFGRVLQADVGVTLSQDRMQEVTDFIETDAGSIPAASTNFLTKTATCVAAFSFEAPLRHTRGIGPLRLDRTPAVPR